MEKTAKKTVIAKKGPCQKPANKNVRIKFQKDRISDRRSNCTFLGVRDETKITFFIIPLKLIKVSTHNIDKILTFIFTS